MARSYLQTLWQNISWLIYWTIHETGPANNIPWNPNNPRLERAKKAIELHNKAVRAVRQELLAYYAEEKKLRSENT